MAFNLPSLIFCLCLLSVSAISAHSGSDDKPTVYELLPKYGLPSGLLPDSVKSYSLSDDDGRFIVDLEDPCYVQFDYLVYYEKRITGNLNYGSITHLEGIQVKKFFLWLDVDEIRVDMPPSNSIYFKVGIITKELDVDQFKTVHSCRQKLTTSCGRSLKRVVELPTTVDDIQMLIIE
ncbi:hypothetical protein NMG60_11017813 [Bertholletia excelsa]